MTALQWMQREAKKIRKSHPKMSPQSVMKEAGRLYRKAKTGKKMSGAYTVKKVGAAKKVGSPKKAVTRAKSVGAGDVVSDRSIGSLTSVMSQGRKILLEQIGRLEGKYIMATTKTDKRRIRKIISEKKVQLRRLMIK